MKIANKIIILLFLVSSLVFVGKVFAGALLFEYGLVFYVDSGGVKQSGDATTPNSFAIARVFRYNVDTNFYITNSPSANHIFPAAETPGDPAYLNWDIGSSGLSPSASAGDQLITVLQTYTGMNSYSGPSYVAGQERAIELVRDLNTNSIDYDPNDFTMEPVPTPTFVSSTTSSLTMHFKGLYDDDTGAAGGLAYNTVVSYSIYKSTDGGAYQAHGSPYAIVAQSAGNMISYTDNSVLSGHLYKYKLTVNYKWTAHTPAYYETVAEGPISANMSLSPVIDHFDFVLATPQNMSTPFTGTNTLTARDINGNALTNYDTTGSDVTITENAAGGNVTGLSSPGNVIHPASFVNGVANLTGTMTYGGLYGARVFKATAGAINSLSNSVTLNQGSFAKFGLNLNTPQQNAAPFTTANITAQDIFGNVLTNFDTVGEGVNITVDTGSVNVTTLARTDFIAGTALLTGINFTLTGLVGTHTVTFTSQGTGIVVSKFVTLTAGPVTSVKIMDAPGAGATEVGNANVNIDSPVTYTAAGFDTSGNFVSNLTSGNWTSASFDGTDTFAQVSSTGTNLIFAPHKSPSSGTITFNAAGKTDTTGTITVISGAATTFNVVAPGTATAGTPFSLTSVTALDKYFNTATSYVGTKTLVQTGASTGPESGTPTASITATFTLGVAPTTSPITLVKVETIKLTSTQGSVAGQSANIVVSQGTAQHFHASAPTSAVAGVPFNVTSITAHDQYGNPATAYGSSQTISCGTLTGFNSPNGDAPVCNPTLINFTNGVSIDPFAVTLFKTGSTNLPITDGSINGNLLIPINITAGAVGSITKVSGDNQSAPVNTTLPLQIIVQVKDLYGNLKSGQLVTYTIASGGGSIIGANPTTDASGNAGNTWKIGTTAGTNTDTANATVAGATGSPITFTANGTPAVATTIEVVAPTPQVAGTSFNITLNAKDSLGNTDSTFSGLKTLTFSIPGNGPTSGTPTYPANVTFAGGTATVAVTLVKAETTTMHVIAGALAGTSNSIVVGPGVATTFSSLTVPSSVTAGVPFNVTAITAKDQFGNLATSYGASQTISCGSLVGHDSPNGDAPVCDPATISFAGGISTTPFSVTLFKRESLTLQVSDGSITGSSISFNVNAGAVGTITQVSGDNQSAPVNSVLPSPLTVLVKDLYGNLKNNQSVTYAVTAGGGSISGTNPATTDTNGSATGNFQLGVTAGSSNNTATASVAGATGSPVTFTASGTPSVGTVLEVVVPSPVTAGTSFNVVLNAKDSLGNIDTTFTGSKTLTFSNPANGPVTGTPTYPANVVFTNGTATVSVTLVKAEVPILHVVAGALAGNSNSFTVDPGATTTFLVAAPTTATVNVAFALTSIHSADQFGNPTTDYTGSKTLAYSGPAGSPTYTTAVDFTAGSATTLLATTLVTIENVAITITDGPISGVSNNINVINPEPFYLQYVSGNNQTGSVGAQLPQPLVVAVRDQSGTLVAGKTIQFVATAGSVSAGSVVSDSSGLVQVNWTLGTTIGSQSVTASMVGITTTVIFNSTATVGAASRLSFSTSVQTIRVNAVSGAVSVCLQDQFGNSALASSDTNVDFSSTSTAPLFALTTGGPWGITQAVISSGSSCISIYYKDATIGSFNLTAGNLSLSSTTQAINIIANTLTLITVTPGSFSVASNATQQMTATVYDQNNQIDNSATVVWSVSNPSAGAITSTGLYYPSANAASYPNAIVATIGSLTGTATPTITAATTNPTPTPTPQPTASPTVVYTNGGSSATATASAVANNTTNVSNPTTTSNYTIDINNYYLGSGDQTVLDKPLSVMRNDYPVIISPKNGSLVSGDNVTISGTAGRQESIVLADLDNNVISTTLSDNDGDWKVTVAKNRLSKSGVQIVAIVSGTDAKSVATNFFVKKDDWLSRLIEMLNT